MGAELDENEGIAVVNSKSTDSVNLKNTKK
jgi:hypothetical protein